MIVNSSKFKVDSSRFKVEGSKFFASDVGLGALNFEL